MIFINVILRKKAILSKYASPKSFGNLVAWRWHRLQMLRNLLCEHVTASRPKQTITHECPENL
jgi:hypothetical protein